MEDTKFIVVDNNKVLGVFDGPLFGDGRNCLHVPNECPIQQGQDVREYDSDWQMRPLVERVADGLVKIDSHFEVIGESIRPKSIIRLILDKIEELPVGYKMVAETEAPDGFPPVDGYALVPLTPYELMQAGKIDKPAGMKLVADTSIFGGLRLDPMTPEERVAAGELTESDLERSRLMGEAAFLQEYLDSTDWYVDRKAEIGKEIPSDISSARQAARDRISAIRVDLAK